MGEVHADDVQTNCDSISRLKCLSSSREDIPERSELIFSTELVLGPIAQLQVSDGTLLSWEIITALIEPDQKQPNEHIPMVQMMDVRRKFLAGTISVLSLECHSSFIRLLRWSRELLAAILNC